MRPARVRERPRLAEVARFVELALRQVVAVEEGFVHCAQFIPRDSRGITVTERQLLSGGTRMMPNTRRTAS
jgi:hypothetical protein